MAPVGALGEDGPQQGRVPFYRCGLCDLNWPFDEPFEHCPQCDMPTAMLHASMRTSIMSYAEAHSKLRHLAFDIYMENETPEARESRQRAWDESTEALQAVGLAEFRLVIACAGFLPEERAVIMELEAQLPGAHLSTEES